MSYEQDRKRIAYGFALATVLIVGWLTVRDPSALNPVVVGIISLFLVCTLALLGVENPMQKKKDDDDDDTYLERLAKGGQGHDGPTGQGGRDEGEASARHDRRPLLDLWPHHLAGECAR